MRRSTVPNLSFQLVFPDQGIALDQQARPTPPFECCIWVYREPTWATNDFQISKKLKYKIILKVGSSDLFQKGKNWHAKKVMVHCLELFFVFECNLI